MKLIVGLGNPGPKYRETRHNAGFKVLDRLAERLQTGFAREKYFGAVAEASYENTRLILLKPLTFMNKSGLSVARALRYTSIALADTLVVVDDVNLPLGRLRLRGGGSSGGHNGLKSISASIGSEAFPRLRLGVGAANAPGEMVNYVLSAFASADRPEAEAMFDQAVDVVLQFTVAGLDRAMNAVN